MVLMVYGIVYIVYGGMGVVGFIWMDYLGIIVSVVVVVFYIGDVLGV